MEMTRMPRIGDLIIHTDRNNGKKRNGLVINIERNKWNHETAIIEWDKEKFYLYKIILKKIKIIIVS